MLLRKFKFKEDFFRENLLNQIDKLVWGVPLLMLLVGTGIYLTLRLKLLQILKLPLALKYVFKKDDES
ncbi:hypothetical protein ACY0IX_15225, partial [Clostridium perfringens]